MATKEANAALTEAFRAAMKGPKLFSITGATAYWIEDSAGKCLTPESASSKAPLAAVLDLVNGGFDLQTLSLVCRIDDGTRYVVGSGPGLGGLARMSAGIPRPASENGYRSKRRGSQ